MDQIVSESYQKNDQFMLDFFFKTRFTQVQ